MVEWLSEHERQGVNERPSRTGHRPPHVPDRPFGVLARGRYQECQPQVGLGQHPVGLKRGGLLERLHRLLPQRPVHSPRRRLQRPRRVEGAHRGLADPQPAQVPRVQLMAVLHQTRVAQIRPPLDAVGQLADHGAEIALCRGVLLDAEEVHAVEEIASKSMNGWPRRLPANRRRFARTSCCPAGRRCWGGTPRVPVRIQ